MKLNVLVVVVLSLIYSGCANVRPDKIPDFSKAQFKTYEYKTLQPRSVELVVVTDRTANKRVGNDVQVALEVKRAFENALAMSRVSSDANSPNHLVIHVEDCDGAPAESACVAMAGTLKSSRSVIEVGGYSSNGYNKGSSGFQSYGNLDQAYVDAMEVVLEGLNRQLTKLSTGH